MVKCKNCREQGCNSETGKAPWYCELCFWMKRMDKKMVIHIVSEMNLEKIKTSFTRNKKGGMLISRG